jgi:hypothetical protein
VGRCAERRAGQASHYALIPHQEGTFLAICSARCPCLSRSIYICTHAIHVRVWRRGSRTVEWRMWCQPILQGLQIVDLWANLQPRTRQGPAAGTVKDTQTTTPLYPWLSTTSALSNQSALMQACRLSFAGYRGSLMSADSLVHLPHRYEASTLERRIVVDDSFTF